MSAKWKKDLRTACVAPQEAGQCKRCGTCCAFISIPPFTEDELDRVPVEIQHVVEWYTQNNLGRPQLPVPCYFYDMTSRTCLIHEHKPRMCRDFEPDGPACRKVRSDLLSPLNTFRDATREWARHYTRVVAPGRRIQQIGEFAFDDEPAAAPMQTQ